MEKNKRSELPFAKFHHIGVVVKDIDKAVEYYSSLGFGPFLTPRLKIKEGLQRGKSLMTKPVIKQAKVGGITLELLQPTQDESLAREFLESKGEGINHIGFSVDDIDTQANKLVKKGFKVIFSQKFEQGGGCAYLNTDKVGGILIELFSHPLEF